MTHYQSVRHYFCIHNDSKEIINNIKLMISKLKLKKNFTESLYSIQTEEKYTIIQTLFAGNESVDIFNPKLLEQIDTLDNGSYAIALYNSDYGVAYGIYGSNSWEECETNSSFTSKDSLQIGLLANSRHWKNILGKKLKVPKKEDLEIWQEEILNILLPDQKKSYIIDNLFIRKEGFELVLTKNSKSQITLQSLVMLKEVLDKLRSLGLHCDVHLKKAKKQEGMYINTFMSSHCWDILSVITKDGDIMATTILTPKIKPVHKSFIEQKMIIDLEKRYDSNVFNNTFLEELSSQELKAYYDQSFKPCSGG